MGLPGALRYENSSAVSKPERTSQDLAKLSSYPPRCQVPEAWAQDEERKNKVKSSLDSPRWVRRAAGRDRGCQCALLTAFSYCRCPHGLLPQVFNQRRGGVPGNPRPGRTQKFPAGEEVNPLSSFQSPSHVALRCSLAGFCPAEGQAPSSLSLWLPTLGFLVLRFCSKYRAGDTAYLKCPVWETF